MLTCCDLRTEALQASLSWDSPGKNTGVGCHAPLQVIFPVWGSNLHLMSPVLAGRFFLPLVPTGKSIHIYLTALGSTVCPHIYMKISVNQVNKQSEYSGVTFMNIGAKIRNNNYM